MRVLQHLPEIEGSEFGYIESLLQHEDDDTIKNFALVYRARRKSETIILITTLIGFLGLAGIQRFLVGQVGMGILYVLTAGLCFIGTIVDLVNHKELAFEYNAKLANDVLNTIKR